MSKGVALNSSAVYGQVVTKTNYIRDECIESFYTGGCSVSVVPNRLSNTIKENDENQNDINRLLITNYGEEIVLTSVNSGRPLKHIATGHDNITALTATRDGKYLISASQNLMVSVFDLSSIKADDHLDRFKTEDKKLDDDDDEIDDKKSKSTTKKNDTEDKPTVDENGLLSQFKAHSGPVLVMDTDQSCSLLATGSADSTVRVWDIEHKFCTHNFKGHQGVVSAVKFMVESESGIALLATGSDADCSVRLWDLYSKQQIYKFDGHSSVVRGIDFSLDMNTLVTSGRDKIINVWDISSSISALKDAFQANKNENKNSKKAKNQKSSKLQSIVNSPKLTMTIPTLETIESIKVVNGIDLYKGSSDKNDENVVVCTAGSSGQLKLWDLSTGQVVIKESNDIKSSLTKDGHESALSQYTDLLYLPEDQKFVCVTSDQNIIIKKINDDVDIIDKSIGFKTVKAFAGYNQEILDLTFIDLSTVVGYAVDHNLKGEEKVNEEVNEQIVEDMQFDDDEYDDTLVIGENVQILGNLSDPSILAKYNEQLKDSGADIEELKRQIETMKSPEEIKKEKLKEALDASKICYGPSERMIAVATNTEQLRLYDLKTMQCDLLTGHSAIIMCVASSADGTFIATGSKDHTCIVWKRVVVYSDDKEPIIKFVKFAEAKGHTEPITSVAFSNFNLNDNIDVKSNVFLVTGSQDRTLKIWDLYSIAKEEAGNTVYGLNSTITFRAHEKDIQSVTVSPNNKLIASCGLDKLAKIWSSVDGSLVGTCKGHKRGLWSVKFSPIDQIVATSSTDKTIKVWSLKDFSCIKTFEGNLNTVLRIEFLSSGMQIVSCGSDGLLKLWDVRSSECIKTIDAHEDRIWALSKSSTENRIATGSSDSQVFIWRDITVEETITKAKESELKIQLEQDLANSVKARNWNRAIAVALELEDKLQLLKLFRELPSLMDVENENGVFRQSKYGIFSDKENEDKDEEINTNKLAIQSNGYFSCTSEKKIPIVFGKTMDSVILNLSKRKFRQLVKYTIDWNKTSTNCVLAQKLLRLFITRKESRERLTDILNNDQLSSLITYSERHFTAANERTKAVKIIDYTVSRMTATGSVN